MNTKFLNQALIALAVAVSFSVQAQVLETDNGGIHGGGGVGVKYKDGATVPLDIAEASLATKNGKPKYFDPSDNSSIRVLLTAMLLTLDQVQIPLTGNRYTGHNGMPSMSDKALRLLNRYSSHNKEKRMKKFKPMTFVWSDATLPNSNDQGVVSLDATTLANIVGNAFETSRVQLAYQTGNTVRLYRPEIEKMLKNEDHFVAGAAVGEGYAAVLLLHETLLRVTIQEHPEIIQKYGTEPVRRLVQMLFEITWYDTVYPPELRLQILHGVGQDRDIREVIY